MNWIQRGLSTSLNIWFSLSVLCPLWAGTGLDSLQQLPTLPLLMQEVTSTEALSLEGKHPSEYDFAIANPTDNQVEAWLKGDYLALEGVFALDSIGQGSALGNFFSRASEIVGEARAAIAEVREIGNFISQFDGSSLVKLPVGMSRQLDDGTMFTVSINRMTLYPSHAELTVYVEVKTGDMEQPLYFGSPAIRFTRMGGIQLGSVGLLSDFPIPILNGKATLDFKGAQVDADNEFLQGIGTYANFDCDGVSQFNLDVDVVFDRSVIRPADLNDQSQIRSELNLNVQNGLNDIVVGINIDRPFVHPEKTDVIWTVQNVVFDFSESHNDPGVVFPVAEYTPDLPPGENNDYPMWKGVYIGEFSVQLPEDLFGSGGDPPQIGVNDLIIDHTGFTGFVNLEPVLSLDEGNMDGWAFSVDRLEVQFYQNSLAAFEFNGKVNLPIFNDSNDGTPQDTACIAYFSSFDIRDQIYAFSMNETEERVYNIKMLRATVTLAPTSRLDIVYSAENGFDATATLNGVLEIDAAVGQEENSNGGPRLQVPAVGFEGLVIANRNGFIRSGGTWDVDTVEVSLNAFTCTVSSIDMVDGAEPNTADLRFIARVNLGRDSTLAFSAQGGFRLQGVIEELEEGHQNWRFDRFRMDMLFVEADNPTFAFEGHVIFFEDLADYGAGFQGKMSLTLKKLGGVGIEAIGLFGSENEQRYFFVDVMTRLPAGMLTVGTLDFRGFSGGVYVNMTQGALVNDFSATGTDSVIADYDPDGGTAAIDAYEAALVSYIGRGLSGTVYTVDTSVKLGINLGVVIATAGKEEAFNANVSLNMEFERAGGLRHLRLQGFANAMAPISWSGPSCSGVSVEFTMNYTDGSRTLSGVGEFTAQARVFVNLEKIRGGTQLDGTTEDGQDCALYYAGGVDLKFSSADWWINLGVPEGTPAEYQPDGPINLVTEILDQQVLLTGYLDIGNRIPPFPGLPTKVAELTRLPNLIQDEANRASGRGFAFGVNLHTENKIDVIGIVKASLELDIGFDIMLQYYDMTCANNGGDKIGFGGWYAAGQAWVYVEGSVSVLNFNILNAAIAAAIQVKGPNPFYGRGAFAGRYSVLGGLKKGSFRFPIEFGQQCEAEDGSVQELDYNIISGVLPLDMMQNSSITVKPGISFNYPVDEVVSLPDAEGSYVIRLDEFEVKKDNALLVEGSQAWSSDRYAMEFLPYEMLLPNTTYTIYATASLYPSDADGNITGAVRDTDIETVTFTTGDALGFIPIDNVMAAWPADQQFNYYQDEGLENFIHLASGQDELVTDALDNGAVLRISNGLTTDIDINFNYDPNLNKITYDLPSLTPGGVYEASIVFPDEDERRLFFEEGETRILKPVLLGEEEEAENLLSFYFRVSNYGTFTEKMNAINFSNLNGGISWSADNTTTTYEPFGIEELVGIPWIPGGPTLELRADLNATPWMQQFHAISVPGIGSFDLYGTLGDCDFDASDLNYQIDGLDRADLGLVPEHAVGLNQSIVPAIEEGFQSDIPGNVEQELEYLVPTIVNRDYRALSGLSKSTTWMQNRDNAIAICNEVGNYCEAGDGSALVSLANDSCVNLFFFSRFSEEPGSPCCAVKYSSTIVYPRYIDVSLTDDSPYPVIFKYTFPDNSHTTITKTLQL